MSIEKSLTINYHNVSLYTGVTVLEKLSRKPDIMSVTCDLVWFLVGVVLDFDWSFFSPRQPFPDSTASGCQPPPFNIKAFDTDWAMFVTNVGYEIY